MFIQICVIVVRDYCSSVVFVTHLNAKTTLWIPGVDSLKVKLCKNINVYLNFFKCIYCISKHELALRRVAYGFERKYG